jgi:hypothetical protein
MSDVRAPLAGAANDGGWFRRRVRSIWRHSFRDRRRERLFLASLGFFVTFGVVRVLTHSMRDRATPFALFVGDVHVHHLVYGIVMLLAVGFVWLHAGGTGPHGLSPRTERWLSILYGVGAALTLDEFALWLNLQDVYWEREGRASIDAVLLFGGLVSAGLWGGPFLRAVARFAGRVIRRRSHEVAVEVAVTAQEVAAAAEAAAASAAEVAAAGIEIDPVAVPVRHAPEPAPPPPVREAP